MKLPPVSAQVNTKVQLNQAENRRLMRQGQAVRGHDEAEGNLHQMLLLWQTDIPELKRWMQEGKYMSPEIVNELISEMGQKVLQELLSKIQEARWFSLIADETRDISNIEQLTISIRWISSDYMVHEEPIGLVQVPRTNAETLTSALKDVLIWIMLPLQKYPGKLMMELATCQGTEVALPSE